MEECEGERARERASWCGLKKRNRAGGASALAELRERELVNTDASTANRPLMPLSRRAPDSVCMCVYVYTPPLSPLHVHSNR